MLISTMKGSPEAWVLFVEFSQTVQLQHQVLGFFPFLYSAEFIDLL
jgi:hypothetical protein